MTGRARCTGCGRWTCTAMCLMLSAGGVAPALQAQGSTTARSAPVGSSAAVSIGGMFLFTPSAPPLLPAESSCGDAHCFVGTATVRANQAWQLQVRLEPGTSRWGRVEWDGAPGTLADVGSAAPASAGTMLGASWVTVARGAAPTAGTPITLRIRVSARPGEPTAGRPEPQLISAAVQYRVVGDP